MPGEPKLTLILESAICGATLFADDFRKFVDERGALLKAAAEKLTDYKDAYRDSIFAQIKAARVKARAKGKT